jgi:hypothetical protein
MAPDTFVTPHLLDSQSGGVSAFRQRIVLGLGLLVALVVVKHGAGAFS